MKKLLRIKICFVVGLLGVWIPSRAVGDAQAPSPSSSSEQVFQALHDATLESLDLQRGTTKKKKKKFLKRLIKELVITTLNLALEVMSKGSRRSYHDAQAAPSQTSQIQAYLQEIFIAEGRKIPDELCDGEVHDLFDTLYSYYAEKVDSLQNGLKQQVLENYKTVFHGVSCEDTQSFEDVEECAFVAMATVNRIGDVRCNWPAIWRFVKLVATIGELAQSRNAKEEFVEKVAVLIDDLREFLSYDNLLASFEKLSKFLQQIKEKPDESDLKQFLRDILESSQDGARFLEEIFSSVSLYMREKLSHVVAELFTGLSQS